MAELIFTQSSDSNQIYLAPEGQFWCAFLLPETLPDKTPKPGSTIKFSETVQYQGYYLFAASIPNNISQFITNAYQYLNSIKKNYQAGAIVWFQQPDNPFSNQNIQLIYLQAKSSSSFTLLTSYNFNFGNNFITLSLASGTGVEVDLDTVNNRFIISGPPMPEFINLSANNIASNTEPQSNVEIPLTGCVMGAIRFIVGLNHGTDLEAFDVSQKYFFSNNNSLNEINYLCFQDGSQNDLILTQASINPLDLLNQSAINTYLALIGLNQNKNTNQTYPTNLATNFRSDYGIPISFIPNIDLSSANGSANIPSVSSAILTFSERSPDDHQDNWYTIPTGYFIPAVSNDDEKHLDKKNQFRLICGLSGTESISITAQTSNSNGDFICFSGNRAAYINQYPISNNTFNIGANKQQTPLSKNYLTAWIGVLSANSNVPIIYHSQPQGSSLYTNSSSDNFLSYFIANSGTLSGHKNIIYFPMVSYGKNTQFPTKFNAAQFEQQILSPNRKITIADALINAQNSHQSQPSSTNQDTTPPIQSTSPQGFYLEVNPATAQWEKMQLASNQFLQSQGTLSPIYNLYFSMLTPELQSAFQTNQLFLVVTYNNDGILGDFYNLMEIEEWPFEFKVPQSNTYGQYNNILIFKFCDQSLQERVNNIQYWTQPDKFNNTTENGLPNISSWLNEYIQQGINKYEQQHDNDYYKFSQIVTDPNWQGMLALKVNISLTNFPKELQGLLAGIDLSRFNAHHFGIDMSVVKSDSKSLTMQPTSSLFGLINYEDTTFQSYNSDIERYQSSAPINTSANYIYRVLQLKVAFENSRIINFNSYIALTINQLFGESVDTSNRANLQILKGTYENHNGIPAYTFDATSDNVIKLNSHIIQDVEILKSNFVTLVSQDTQKAGQVESRFSFFGYINFYALSGMDLLSFGNEDNTPLNNKGVAFSNLYIDLSFPLDTPTNQVFTFDIESISFDLGSSYSRSSSLYRHFPLQLNGLISGTKDNSPDAQGYLNLSLPSLEQQQAVNGNWYALTFKLNMGTLGSLASSAGFNTTFMIAWNVGGNGVSAGLKLPGVNPQAPALSLQGVLKLDIGSLSLSVADDNKSYLMKLNNIALKVLGLSFPPGGNIGFFLFGNPATTAPPESLGWYGAYVKNG
ncbi:hypothetical protein [Aliikangiella maris]|uniref:Uncharacterized protein n=2 Tax=Aliikangiella maris TaxID=3162458 RepID=A0ABV2BSS0_9GAMM